MQDQSQEAVDTARTPYKGYEKIRINSSASQQNTAPTSLIRATKEYELILPLLLGRIFAGWAWYVLCWMLAGQQEQVVFPSLARIGNPCYALSNLGSAGIGS